MKCQEHQEKRDEECLTCTQRALDVALLQVGGLRKLADAAVAFLDNQRTDTAVPFMEFKRCVEDYKRGTEKQVGDGQRGHECDPSCPPYDPPEDRP